MSYSKFFTPIFFALSSSLYLTAMNNTIDKKKLHNDIRDYTFYNVIHGIASLDIDDRVKLECQNNDRLKIDLYAYYDAFDRYPSKEEAQQIVESFCTKWDLQKIDVLAMKE